MHRTCNAKIQNVRQQETIDQYRLYLVMRLKFNPLLDSQIILQFHLKEKTVRKPAYQQP